MVAGRAGAFDREPALAMLPHHTSSNFPRKAPGQFSPSPMSLEFQLMACSTAGFQRFRTRRGRTPVHNLASVILNEGRRHG
jgi:hypothetical protein